MHDKALLMALYKRLNDGAIDLEKFYQLVVRAAVEVLAGSRASIWFFEGTLQDTLVCQTMFERSSGSWSAGLSMTEDDCGPYFQALMADKCVSATDGHLQPDTACLDRLEFTPAVSYALHDLLIEVNGAAAGMLRCERDGVSEWSADDDVYLKQVAAMLGLILKKRG